MIDLAIVVFLAALSLYLILQSVAMITKSVLIRSNTALERNLLRSQLKQVMDARRFEKNVSEFSWSGYRKFEVVRKVDEGGDIASFYLAPHDQKKLPPFLPGQYLTFRIDVHDSERTEAKPVVRCYSLSDSPNHPDYYRVSIKKAPPPRDKPDAAPGLVSHYFHQNIKVGNILDVKSPTGKFTLDLAKSKYTYKRSVFVFISSKERPDKFPTPLIIFPSN